MPLLFSYKEKLRNMPLIKGVAFASWFGGVYQESRNFFPQFAIDVDTYRIMYPEFIIDDSQWDAFLKDREGCIVGRNILERFKWNIVDRIPIQATIYQGLWEFNIKGVYDGKRDADDSTQFWFHYKYLNEQTPFQKDYVGWYLIRTDDPDNASAVTKTIDDRFSNSAFETTTETEKTFAAGFVKQFGNIKLIILPVGSVVFFTLLPSLRTPYLWTPG